MFDDKTMTFSLGQNREDDIKQILTIVYDAPSIKLSDISCRRIPRILQPITTHAA